MIDKSALMAAISLATLPLLAQAETYDYFYSSCENGDYNYYYD